MFCRFGREFCDTIFVTICKQALFAGPPMQRRRFACKTRHRPSSRAKRLASPASLRPGTKLALLVDIPAVQGALFRTWLTAPPWSLSLHLCADGAFCRRNGDVA
jgi:hypothetical protein